MVHFWKGLGFNIAYQMRKNGNEYCCMCRGYDLGVLFTSVMFDGSSKPDGSSKTDGLLVEVSVLASEEDYIQAGEAVIEFSDKLRPLVNMTKAFDVFAGKR